MPGNEGSGVDPGTPGRLRAVAGSTRAVGLVVGWRSVSCLRRWRFAELRSGLPACSGAQRSQRCGAAGVAVSLRRPAVGYGLRPTRDCARCSADRASSEGRRVAGWLLRPSAQRASASSASLRSATLSACAPRRFRHRETATPATPLDDVSSLGEKRLRCARAGERDVEPVAPPFQLAISSPACPHARACGARGLARERSAAPFVRVLQR